MYYYVICFLTFSFLGWCAEVAFHFLKDGRVVNRGLAYGPVCPIYGIGVSLCALLLSGVESMPLALLLCAAIATAVELFVGLICDRFIGHRLWSYESEWGNILGLVCPRFSLLWGFLLMLTLYTLPLFDRVVEAVDVPGVRALTYALLGVLLIDVSVSTFKIKRQKSHINPINYN
jgi:uncharacterized membrane protein